MLLTRDLAIYDARYHLHGDLRIKGMGEKGSTIYNTSQAEKICCTASRAKKTISVTEKLPNFSIKFLMVPPLLRQFHSCS